MEELYFIKLDMLYPVTPREQDNNAPPTNEFLQKYRAIGIRPETMMETSGNYNLGAIWHVARRPEFKLIVAFCDVLTGANKAITKLTLYFEAALPVVSMVMNDTTTTMPAKGVVLDKLPISISRRLEAMQPQPAWRGDDPHNVGF